MVTAATDSTPAPATVVTGTMTTTTIVAAATVLGRSMGKTVAVVAEVLGGGGRDRCGNETSMRQGIATAGVAFGRC